MKRLTPIKTIDGEEATNIIDFKYDAVQGFVASKHHDWVLLPFENGNFDDVGKLVEDNDLVVTMTDNGVLLFCEVVTFSTKQTAYFPVRSKLMPNISVATLRKFYDEADT